ncbi:helix-turn-helix domain-containing protein [Phytohabitans suffuscus]|uniref:Transcriptional regulator n=1 Tax=Phytohabitans suffuscus TaxID=624315 RepID=A0A6F8YDD5_9ACTN|nr:helix-turn-helix transcriptional regulator [Phytohabitans suffuscus]BCB84112.1 transcriptional regulator [Phytohabitans suffuscus]
MQAFIPTLRAQWLGQHLRELREQRGLTLKLVAEHLNRHLSALGRYESAEWPIPRTDVVNLMELYGIHDTATRDRLLRVAENVWRTHRWCLAPSDNLDASFIDLSWLADRAERLCLFHPGMVPKPLQLPEYHEPVARYTHPSGQRTEAMEQYRELQGALVGTDTKIQAVVDESALHRTIGGVDVLRAQLAHLRDLQQRGQAEIRVLPADVALHPGLSGPFWLFELPQPYAPVGYQDGLAGACYVEMPQVERFVDTYRQLADAAMGLFESVGLIEKRIAELT